MKINDSGSVLVMIIIVIMILMTLSITILVIHSTNVQTISLNDEKIKQEYKKTYIEIFEQDPEDPEEPTFVEFIIEENVFVYGTHLFYSGNSVSGPGSTIVVTGDLLGSELNKNANINVTNIYIDGKVDLAEGSITLGSAAEPGDIYINGDLLLTQGRHETYGNVHVAGNLFLKNAVINGDIYVAGNVTLDWTPTINEPARIYYTGTLTHPPSMGTDITSKCIQVATVPAFAMPSYSMPGLKPDAWYAEKGYLAGGPLADGIKIFADNYVSNTWRPYAHNVVIVSKGDINLTNLGGSGLSGVLFAPNGQVTFDGGSFEGVVIARDGFFVTSGGTTVTFKNIDNYIDNIDDYPF